MEGGSTGGNELFTKRPALHGAEILKMEFQILIENIWTSRGEVHSDIIHHTDPHPHNHIFNIR